MRKQLLTAFIASIVFVFSIGTAVAQDVSLVIGNKSYRHAEWMYGAESSQKSVRALRDAGFVVVSGRDMDGVQTRRALVEFVGRVKRAEHVAVVLNGHFVSSNTETWFVPVDVRKPNILTIGFDGVSLNALLELVGKKPGGATVFLGTADLDFDLGAGLSRGLGDLNIPQGVFVATGTPKDIDSALRNNFLAQGAGLADALANAPKSIRGFGYVSNYSTVMSMASVGAGVDEDVATERGFWQATLDMGTKRAMENYLSQYPRGEFANDARDWIDSQDSKTPEELAKEAEVALKLSRSERRKIQKNLTMLGFNTRGVDGILGRGSRQAIGDWQERNGFTKTGYLRSAQIRRLANQAAVQERKLAEEARQEREARERADTNYWHRSGAEEGREAGLRRYLRRYPDGLFAGQAKARLQEFDDERQREARIADRNAWDDAAAIDTVDAYEAYLADFPEGKYVGEANERLTAIRGPSPEDLAIEAAKQEEASLRMNIIAKILVEGRLNALGYKAGPEDGNFDERTRKALRKFQELRGFPVTGYLTRQSLVTMIAETGG